MASPYPRPTVIPGSEPAMGVIRQFVAIWAHFFQKTAWVKGSVALAGDGEAGREKIEHVLGACAGDVEQPTLFFDVALIDGPRQG